MLYDYIRTASHEVLLAQELIMKLHFDARPDLHHKIVMENVNRPSDDRDFNRFCMFLEGYLIKSISPSFFCVY